MSRQIEKIMEYARKRFFVKLKNFKNYSFGWGLSRLSSNEETLIENIFIGGEKSVKQKTRLMLTIWKRETLGFDAETHLKPIDIRAYFLFIVLL